MRTVPGFCASFSNFPPSPLDQTISVNHPQSPQLISFVCVQKNSPEVDGSNELKSIGCNRKRQPSRYSPTRILTQHASRTFKRGKKCSLTLWKGGISVALEGGGVGGVAVARRESEKWSSLDPP